MSKYSDETMKKLLGRTEMPMYCVKCRIRQLGEAEEVIMKNGKQAWKAKCPDCQTGMYKIGAYPIDVKGSF